MEDKKIAGGTGGAGDTAETTEIAGGLRRKALGGMFEVYGGYNTSRKDSRLDKAGISKETMKSLTYSLDDAQGDNSGRNYLSADYMPVGENDQAGAGVRLSSLPISPGSKYITAEGDVLFSLQSALATVVSKATAGKLITTNFAKIVPGDEMRPFYDPWCLCYMLNEDPGVRAQINTALRPAGSDAMASKLTVGSLKEISVYEIRDKEIQEAVGTMYNSAVKRRHIRNTAADLELRMVVEKIQNGIERLVEREEEN